MIRFVRSASIAPGKFGDALAYAKQICEYLGKHHGVKVELMMPVGGNPHRIAWRIEYASLAAMEESQSKFMADANYVDLISKGGTNFVAGSANDAIWRTL